MAKFVLNIYDMKTEKVEKTYSRNIVPVSLYIKFQTLNEKLQSEQINSDSAMFEALQELFVETFAGLTTEEYNSQTDVAEVLIMFRDILKKATLISSKN